MGTTHRLPPAKLVFRRQAEVQNQLFPPASSFAFPLIRMILFSITMRITCIAFALVLAATAQGAAVPNSHVVHEKRESPPSKWVKREKISSSYVLPMRIGLKQRNLDRGHSFLMDV